jgi:hypothetical protein
VEPDVTLPRAALLMLAVLLASAAIASILVHVACEVPVGESCSTDTECACMHGADE